MAGAELRKRRDPLAFRRRWTAGGGRPLIHPVPLCALAMLAATLAGFALAQFDPALAPATRPHPTLRPTAAAIAAILANNARVLAAPFILIAARFARSRRTALIGDAVIALILGANAISIGLAIGRWERTLVPYLPHLPLEYLATGTAAGAWVDARRASIDGTTEGHLAIGIYAAATLGLLLVAAAVEVLLTPHAR